MTVEQIIRLSDPFPLSIHSSTSASPPPIQKIINTKIPDLRHLKSTKYVKVINIFLEILFVPYVYALRYRIRTRVYLCVHHVSTVHHDTTKMHESPMPRHLAKKKKKKKNYFLECRLNGRQRMGAEGASLFFLLLESSLVPPHFFFG